MATANWRGTRLRPTFDTREEANIWAKEQETRMAKGLDIQAPTKMRTRNSGKPQTMAELLEWTKKHVWLTGGPNGEPKRSADKLIIAARQVVEALGPNTRVASLDFFRIANSLDRLREERGNSEATTNRRKSALSVMLKQAEKLEIIEKRPVIEKKRETRTRSFRVLPGLEDAMLQYAIAEGNTDFYDFLVLALYLGQRENEILRLRFRETAAYPFDGYIDDDFAVFPEQDVENKSQVTHAVPIRPIVREVVSRRSGKGSQSDRILHGVTKSNLDYWFRKMRDSLIDHPDVVSQRRDGLPVGKDFCIHILRHEFCSRLGDQGFDLTEIMRYSGHKTPAMCKRYVKPHKVARRRSLARVPGALPQGLPGGTVPTYAPTQPTIAASTADESISHNTNADSEALMRLLSALRELGIEDLLQDAVAGLRSKAA